MSKKPDSLDRLFRSAALSWDTQAGSPSFELEMRVMAAWNSLGSDEDTAGLTRLFRHGVALAIGLAALAVAASLAQMGPSSTDEWEFSGMMVQFVALR